MSQTGGSTEITVLEYGRLEEIIEDRIRLRQSTLQTRTLAQEAEVSVPKVNEALLHMQRKHGCIREAGAGQWILEFPDE